MKIDCFPAMYVSKYDYDKVSTRKESIVIQYREVSTISFYTSLLSLLTALDCGSIANCSSLDT